MDSDSAVRVRQADEDEPLLPRADSKPSRSRKHLLGLFMLAGAVLLWTLANFLASSIFADNSYAKPFFLTYINSYVYVLTTLPLVFSKIYRRPKPETKSTHTCHEDTHNTLTDAVVERRASHSSAGLERTEAPSASYGTTRDAEDPSPKPADAEELGARETLPIAMRFCVPWFMATYLAAACLQHTTVSSATLLACTISIWVFIFGICFGVERFSVGKSLGVVASCLGVLLVLQLNLPTSSLSSQEAPLRATDKFSDKMPAEITLGNCLALLSEVLFAIVTVLLKKTSMKIEPREVNILVLFHLIGICNAVLGAVAFPIVHFSGLETFSLPPDPRTWLVVLVNSASAVLSDIFFICASLLTTPLVASIGTSLAVPLSLVVEMSWQGHYEGWRYWLGSAVVVGSFWFVDREEVQEEVAAEDP